MTATAERIATKSDDRQRQRLSRMRVAVEIAVLVDFHHPAPIQCVPQPVSRRTAVGGSARTGGRQGFLATSTHREVSPLRQCAATVRQFIEGRLAAVAVEVCVPW